MAAVTISIEPDELLSLRALAELGGVTKGRQPDVAGMAKTLMRRALAASLEERGLPRPASPQARPSPAAKTAEPDSAVPASRTRGRKGKYAASVLAVAVLVPLWGGYARGWEWTGFRANGQLWDWMSLLLLPLVVGTLPLWIEHAGDMSHGKRDRPGRHGGLRRIRGGGIPRPAALDRLPRPDAVGLAAATVAAAGCPGPPDAGAAPLDFRPSTQPAQEARAAA